MSKQMSTSDDDVHNVVDASSYMPTCTMFTAFTTIYHHYTWNSPWLKVLFLFLIQLIRPCRNTHTHTQQTDVRVFLSRLFSFLNSIRDGYYRYCCTERYADTITERECESWASIFWQFHLRFTRARRCLCVCVYVCFNSISHIFTFSLDRHVQWGMRLCVVSKQVVAAHTNIKNMKMRWDSKMIARNVCEMCISSIDGWMDKSINGCGRRTHFFPPLRRLSFVLFRKYICLCAV